MRKIILKVLDEVACGNTGTCQINLQSKSAQIMITEKLLAELEPHVREIVENIVVGEGRHNPHRIDAGR